MTVEIVVTEDGEAGFREKPAPCPQQFSDLGPEYQCVVKGEHAEHRDIFRNRWWNL